MYLWPSPQQQLAAHAHTHTHGHAHAAAVGALEYMSTEMQRLRVQLKSGALSAVLTTYFELEGLTIAMESDLSWAVNYA